MILSALLLTTLACGPLEPCPSALAAYPRNTASSPGGAVTAADSVNRVASSEDSVRHRARAVQVSDAYALRLRIHHLASYATIPLFVAQTVAGNQLYQADKSGAPKPGWASGTHAAGAAGLGVLFTVNTVTGVWNLWDSRHNEVGRTRRIIHSTLLLASDAGFAYSGVSGGNSANSQSARDRHRNISYVSMGAALAGYAVMLVGQN